MSALTVSQDRPLRNRSLLGMELTSGEFMSLVDLAAALKSSRAAAGAARLAGRNVVLLFDEPSTRTRCAFEVAAAEEGAATTYLGPVGSHVGADESVRDTARVLGRMYDGIAYRGNEQAAVEALAASAGVPVWNALTHEWHPTQMLADVLTMREHSPKPLAQSSYCYLGDTRNNTARSLLVTGALLGMDVRLAGPSALWPPADVVTRARSLAAASGAKVDVTDDVGRAVLGVDFLYTDVWLSMGESPDEWRDRIDLLRPFQVNADLVARTGNPNVRFMHCLPSHHNRDTTVGERLFEATGLEALEVTDDVFESERSVVFDEAENRLHTIKAVMVATIGA